jgi:hypothetical protein
MTTIEEEDIDSVQAFETVQGVGTTQLEKVSSRKRVRDWVHEREESGTECRTGGGSACGGGEVLRRLPKPAGEFCLLKICPTAVLIFVTTR